MTEMFERMKKHSVPDVRIGKEEWRKEYAMLYSVLGLNDKEGDLIYAAEEIIMTYLLLQAEKKAGGTRNI